MFFSTTSPEDQSFFKSYSLEGEDIVLKRFFKEKKQGFYVDVGANQPFKFNNTYYFYSLGWRGINIDADGKCVKELEKYRPRDINIEAVVGNYSRKKIFYQFNEKALNTFSKKLVKEYLKAGYKVTKKIPSYSRSLSSILDEYLFEETTIDFMTIDVEGEEYSVLKSNNWEKYKPQVIVLEILGKNSIYECANHKITRYLKKHGYVFFAKVLTSCFYKRVHK